MRVTLGIRYLAVGLCVLFLASCSETYAYLPSVGKPAAATPAEGQAPAAQPAPAVETPARKPDLPQQVQGLEVRVQQLETRLAERPRPGNARRRRRPPLRISSTTRACISTRGKSTPRRAPNSPSISKNNPEAPKPPKPVISWPTVFSRRANTRRPRWNSINWPASLPKAYWPLPPCCARPWPISICSKPRLTEAP